MGDHPLDHQEFTVFRGGGVREDVGGVEDVQARVLHGAGAEIVHGRDHEGVRIVFEAEVLFVPAHGALEGGHGMGGSRGSARGGEYADVHFSSAAGCITCAHFFQAAGDQGEEIAGFWTGIVPHGEVPAPGEGAGFAGTAVAQENGTALFVGPDGNGVHGEDVGSVGEPGDAPEAFGFVLGAEE